MLFLCILSQTAKTGAAPLLPLLRELQQIMIRSNLSFLFSRLNNSSGLSRSLYGFSSRSFPISVFLLWLFSNSFSSLYCGAQNCSQWGYPSAEQDNPLTHPAGDVDPDASPDAAGSHGLLGTADSYSDFADQDPQVPLYRAALQLPSA